MVSEKKTTCIIYGVGTFFAVLGIVLGIAWPFIYDEILQKILVLSKSSYMYTYWSDPPTDAYLDGFLFNWTNSKEFEADPTVKPNFEEIGPFVFKEVRSKEGVSWNEDETLIIFNNSKTWYFVPEESADLSLSITNLNLLPAAIASMARFWPSRFWQTVINALIVKRESYFSTAPARQWLFDGLDDEFLDMLDSFRNLTDIPFPISKVGWFYGRNESAGFDGVFTIRTGVGDKYNLGKVESWNHMKNTSYYNGNCAIIQGEAEDARAPSKDGERKNTSTIFTADLCSTLTLYYSKEVTVSGVAAYEYIGDERTYDNGQLVPENACFCTGECNPSGARNISLCRYGMPAFVSLPHFYGADPSYTENITGMKPDYEKHTFKSNIQPDLGMPIGGLGSSQFSILIQPIEQFDYFRNSPKLYIPMVWFRGRGSITPELGILLNLFINLRYIGMGVFFGIAFIGVLCIAIRFIIVRRRIKLASKIY